MVDQVGRSVIEHKGTSETYIRSIWNLRIFFLSDISSYPPSLGQSAIYFILRLREKLIGSSVCFIRVIQSVMWMVINAIRN